MTRALVFAILAACVATACSHAWDDYDPRLGGSGGGAQSGTGSSTPTSSSETSPASSSSGDGGGANTTTTTSGSTSDSSGSGSPTQTLEIAALAADCTSPEDPDADACDFFNADSAFAVDGESDFGGTWQGYLDFAIGDELAGRTVEAVALRLRTSAEDDSGSSDAGEVWACEPWERDDLTGPPGLSPDVVGDAPLAVHVGLIAEDEDVVFDLAGVVLQPNTHLYLTVISRSMDGVDYLDERSATPPTLVVTYR